MFLVPGHLFSAIRPTLLLSRRDVRHRMSCTSNHTPFKSKILRSSPPLSTTKNQKALNIDSAKTTPTQQFLPSINRELHHDYDVNIPGIDTSFV